MKAVVIGGEETTRISCPKANITTLEIDVSIHGRENTKYIVQQFNMDVNGFGINDIKRGDLCELTTL